MRPILLELPLWGGATLAFPAYGTFLTIGFLAGFLVGRRRAEAIGLESRDVFNFGYLAVISGVVGSHLLHVALHPGLGFGGPGGGLWRALAFWRGGVVFYGGLAGAMLALWFYARHKGVPVLDLMDFTAPLAAIGLAVTRGGCFFNGCCYGRPSDVAWAVSFPPGSSAQRAQWRAGAVEVDASSLPVHPTQLYELVAALAMFGILWAAFPYRRFRGQIVLLFFLLYAPWRFVNETSRAGASSGW